MLGLGVGEIAVVSVIALVFVGPKKIPQMARGLGEGIKEFKKSIRDMGEKEDKTEKSDDI